MKVHLGRYPKDGSKPRKVSVRIDKWDSWNAFETIAIIALPVLQQLRTTKQSSGFIDLEDVPENLRYVNGTAYSEYILFPELENEAIDKAHQMFIQRYNYVLDEVIFALDYVVNNREDQFFTHSDKDEISSENIVESISSIKVDWEGLHNAQARVQKGLELFGKYFQTLWD